ncbi:MAG TPA: GNAT family protein [Candidatus Binataceae bacterium]|jgi:RimJ/RimL family protein N-acetyltransferase
MEGKLVRLRPYEKRDIDDLMKWVNDEEVTRYLGSLMTPPLSRSNEEAFLEMAMTRSETHKVFAIETMAGELAGGIDLRVLEQIDRKAEVGIVIGVRDFWGRGYGTEAMRLMLRFAFGRLNLNRVSLRVFDYNPRAIKSYEKCGFKREGLLRQDRYYDAKYHDTIVMGILREEFEPQAAQ